MKIFLPLIILLALFGFATEATAEICVPEGEISGDLICQGGQWVPYQPPQPPESPESPNYGIAVCGASENNPATPYNETDACDFCDIFRLVSNIFNFVLVTIIPPIATLLVVVGGFLFITAGGSPQNLAKGKTILTAVVIGLIIVYGSWVFMNFLFSALGIATWTGLGSWWQIQCN